MNEQVLLRAKAFEELNDLALKDKAEELSAAGASAEEIQLRTGWVRQGTDWVYDPIAPEQEGGATLEQ